MDAQQTGQEHDYEPPLQPDLLNVSEPEPEVAILAQIKLADGSFPMPFSVTSIAFGPFLRQRRSDRVVITRRSRRPLDFPYTIHDMQGAALSRFLLAASQLNGILGGKIRKNRVEVGIAADPDAEETLRKWLDCVVAYAPQTSEHVTIVIRRWQAKEAPATVH